MLNNLQIEILHQIAFEKSAIDAVETYCFEVCLDIASFWKKKGLKMVKNIKLGIAFYERYLLTFEEAAVYFHIEYKKLRKMIKDYDGAK